MTTAPSRAVMLCGAVEPDAQARTLVAGPISAEFDAGNLRYIGFAGTEAIRAISYVTRDQFWGTDAPEIRDLQIDEGPDGFTITYAATCARSEESYSYTARITGTPTQLTFEATGAGDTDFLTCRTGFVVLHGVQGIVGEALSVEHVDGRITKSVFPEKIDPDCPFRDIRALTHSVSSGVRVRCEMTGDTFEMEDQRNWTDASFKTYVRPLSLPQPYMIAAGEQVTQAVTLTFEGEVSSAAPSNSNEVTVTIGQPQGAIPEIGMWVDAPDIPAAATRLNQLSVLRPAFLSCYLDATKQDAAIAFNVLSDLANSMQAPLALEAVISGDDIGAEMTAIATAAANAGLTFADVAVSMASDLAFVPPGTLFTNMDDFEALFAAARAAFPNARIGGGNFVYFTELNRKPVPAASLDYLLHGTSAVVHAADDRSVTETIECLPYVFRSMRAQYDDKPYRVSPAGIGSRTSPFGNDPTPNPNARRVTMTDKDPRQRGLLGAAWHLSYLARAAACNVDSVALATPTGGFGLIHSPHDDAQPWFDGTGGVFPVYHVLRALYAASGEQCFETEVSASREVQALTFEGNDGPELWLANLTDEPKQVSLIGFTGQKVAVIDETTFVACARDPMRNLTTTAITGASHTLRPYATMRILGVLSS